jgi:Glutathione S-transferase
MSEAAECTDGFFPAVARYLKHTPDGDEKDLEYKAELEGALNKIEQQLGRDDRKGNYLVGDGEHFTLLDCSLAPKLYHLSTGLRAFKDGAIDMKTEFPLVAKYMEAVFNRESFKETHYPEDTIVWGWSNARGN